MRRVVVNERLVRAEKGKLPTTDEALFGDEEFVTAGEDKVNAIGCPIRFGDGSVATSDIDVDIVSVLNVPESLPHVSFTTCPNVNSARSPFPQPNNMAISISVFDGAWLSRDVNYRAGPVPEDKDSDYAGKRHH